MNGSKSLIPEYADVEEVKKKLKALNWEDGKEYGLEENLLLENLIHNSIFDRKFNEINKALLDDLDEKEKREVIDHVKNQLRNAGEDKILEYLKFGIDYTVKRREKRTYRLIDYDSLAINIFIYGNDIKFRGSPNNTKPDFTLFINGIPIAIIEVKSSTRIESEEEAKKQIQRYEEESPDLFRLVQIGIAYGDKKLYTSTYPNWSKEKRIVAFYKWKVNADGSKKESIEEILKHDNILNVIRWYTFFINKEGSLEKIVCRYNQYYASEKALRRVKEYLNNSEKNKGLVWHWQGSGKTHIMFFTANKFFEQYIENNPLVFFIVDRRDLQKQLKEDFLDSLKADRFKSYLKVIDSIDSLKKEIKTIKRSEYKHNIITKQIYIVLIQKFQVKELKPLLFDLANEYLEYKKDYEEISYINNLPEDEKEKRLVNIGGIKKKEVLLLIDEAHRSQYGLLASMVKNIFPNSIGIAFTGTPVFRFEANNTFREFAYPKENEYYLDVYFIKDSIDDGFTLPIVYDMVNEGKFEKDGIRIFLSDEQVKRYIENYLELSKEGSAADEIDEFLEESSEDNLRLSYSDIKKNLNDVKLILINDERLEKLARFIAERVEKDTDNFRFKAMVVTASRKACVDMKRFLDRELEEIYAKRYGDSVKRWTEIVMTYDYNDEGKILEYKEELTNRRGKNDTSEINSDIQYEFKEKEDPKILIVTDMLITGFDAPRLNVMYLDKPLYEHRLLQAIARVNRPYNDGIVEKKFGLVVDSVGLLRNLKESIKMYQLIADERISQDIEENVLGDIEEKAEKFKNNLKDLKGFMKSLVINDRKLTIDIDNLIKLKREDKRKALKVIDSEIDPKLKIIATMHDMPDLYKLLNKLKEVLDQYRALGSHRSKIHYIDEIDLLSYIYGRILHYIKGAKIPKEFWDGLIELIHDNTIVDDFKTVVKTKITGHTLNNAIKRLEEIRVINESDVADAYRMLKGLLEENLTNPIYKAIYDRVERVREGWIDKKIDNKKFVEELIKLSKEKSMYDKDIANRPMIDRIKDTISMLIKQRFNMVLKLNLKELTYTIQEVMDASKITQTHEREIRTALMKDLFKEVGKKVNINLLKRFAEEVSTEYIMQELRKQKG